MRQMYKHKRQHSTSRRAVKYTPQRCQESGVQSCVKLQTSRVKKSMNGMYQTLAYRQPHPISMNSNFHTWHSPRRSHSESLSLCLPSHGQRKFDVDATKTCLELSLTQTVLSKMPCMQCVDTAFNQTSSAAACQQPRSVPRLPVLSRQEHSRGTRRNPIDSLERTQDSRTRKAPCCFCIWRLEDINAQI